MLEMSLEGSNDYSNFNTCDDYLTSARTNRNKYTVTRQTDQNESTEIGDDYPNSGLNEIKLPLTARNRGDAGTAAWNSRNRSLDIGGHMVSGSRNQHNLTTAPMTKRTTSNTRGATPDDFFNADIAHANSFMTPNTKQSIFSQKRNTQQPFDKTTITEVKRGLINQNEPTKMPAYTRKALKGQGCHKEQNKQYVSYVNEATKNNNALRHKIQSQHSNQTMSNKKAAQTPKALMAILPVPEMNNIAINHGNVNRFKDTASA